jgi:hypothetical protein
VSGAAVVVLALGLGVSAASASEPPEAGGEMVRPSCGKPVTLEGRDFVGTIENPSGQGSQERVSGSRAKAARSFNRVDVRVICAS